MRAGEATPVWDWIGDDDATVFSYEEKEEEMTPPEECGLPELGSVTSSAEGFARALVTRDFARLTAMLATDVRMRALLPPGFVEISGAEAAAAKFASWFGDAEELELVDSGIDSFADRLHVFYRLRVRKPGDFPKLVEQHLLCAVDGDRIRSFDLVCAGFRPERDWMMHRPITQDLPVRRRS